MPVAVVAAGLVAAAMVVEWEVAMVVGSAAASEVGSEACGACRF